jgi:hypothetical protein
LAISGCGFEKWRLIWRGTTGQFQMADEKSGLDSRAAWSLAVTKDGRDDEAQIDARSRHPIFG